MKKSTFLLTLFLSISSVLFSQNTFTIEKTFDWNKMPLFDSQSGENYWQFTGGIATDGFPIVTQLSERLPLSSNARLEAEITAIEYETFTKKASRWDAYVGEEVLVKTNVEQERKRFYARISCLPVRKIGDRWERATKITIQVRVFVLPPSVAERGGSFTYNSALENGSIYKFAVGANGVTKLDYDFLKNQLKIDNFDNIDPKTIKIFGNGGKMLPERNEADRADDLIENAVFVSGESDGKFDASDFILFYAEGPQVFGYEQSIDNPELTLKQNIFDKKAYYFVKISSGNGLRLGTSPSMPANEIVTEFDDVRHYEVDQFNLLHEYNQAQGSGKAFYGDYFLQTRTRTYDDFFDFPNAVIGSQGKVRAVFASRSDALTRFELVTDGKVFSSNITSTSTSNNEVPFANLGVNAGAFEVKKSKVSVTVNYPQASATSEGWLDYIEMNVRRRLVMVGNQMTFQNLSSVSADAALKYQISSVTGASPTVWNISNPQKPSRQDITQNASTVEFGNAPQGKLNRFVLFYSNTDFAKPTEAVGKVANQNLHGIDRADLAIIYHPSLEAAVQNLAEHRRNHSGYAVATVATDKLYNEFSSGAKDPTAIRDFARMLLERDDKFRYILLFGDGSFDPRAIYVSPDNIDLVPVFETAESMSPISGHPSDDFFALLSAGEGGELIGALDIAVGRIPAKTQQEAASVVEKIIYYDSKPETLGDWHLRNVFIGDDEDGNVHIRQTEKLSGETSVSEDFFNVEKVYFDAYQQIATSAGDRIPDAKTAVNTNIFKGALVVNYIGHGGPRGWGQERVVDNNDITGWDNTWRLPLFITATCTFGGYDDFQFTAGGELMILKPKTGAIAMFTTVRPVYISGNNQLTNAVQDVLFAKNDMGAYRTMGDILATSKNRLGTTGDQANGRRFTMFGDPSQYLALPELRVATTKINGHAPDPNQPDTLRALQTVNIEGEIHDTLGSLVSDYNGLVYMTVFDKPQTLQTLGQDQGSPVLSFEVQRNTLFRGSATVTDGRFKITFIVPKDINYAFGRGKISYYAHNYTHRDAAGADTTIVIGGNSNAIQDDQAPLVQVFMNDEQFAFGGVTDKSPKIFVKISDDYGVNVSGTSIGHDLSGVVDDNVQSSIILNDFFESTLDDHTRGTVLYPLSSLKPGRHKVYVKAWDIANNSGEGFTEFVVAEDGGAVIDHVLNYPNPFTTNTAFQFEHNLAGQVLDAQISIYTVAGNLVKTINANSQATGYRVSDVSWNGRDDFGDRIGRGVYLYRVKIRGTDFNGKEVTAESDFQKLVLLK